MSDGMATCRCEECREIDASLEAGNERRRKEREAAVKIEPVMALDEIERLALQCVSTSLIADALARAVLAMLPVVRAAERWDESLSEPNGGARRIKEHESLWALRCRLDELHAALGGGK